MLESAGLVYQEKSKQHGNSFLLYLTEDASDDVLSDATGEEIQPDTAPVLEKIKTAYK